VSVTPRLNFCSLVGVATVTMVTKLREFGFPPVLTGSTTSCDVIESGWFVLLTSVFVAERIVNISDERSGSKLEGLFIGDLVRPEWIGQHGGGAVEVIAIINLELSSLHFKGLDKEGNSVRYICERLAVSGQVFLVTRHHDWTDTISLEDGTSCLSPVL